MSRDRSHRPSLIVLPLLVLLAAGCALRFHSRLNPSLPNGLDVSKTPITIGLHYNPDFRSYELVRPFERHRFIVPIGPASVTLIDRVTPLLFDTVVPVDGLPPHVRPDPRITAILEPKVEDADIEFTVFGADHNSRVTYRFTLYSLDGTPFASWIVTGRGQHRAVWGSRAEVIARATDLAMQEAMRIFATEFRHVPEVQRWLRRAGVAATP